MGFELNRLMNQFGVSTPTLSYSGTARPVAPAALAADATAEQRTAFDTAQANYGKQKTAFDADRALFDKYKVDYQSRLQNTPMYLQAQFQRQPQAPAPRSVSDLYRTFLDREPEAEGLQGWNRQFADPQAYLRDNPDVAADPYFSKNPLAHYDQFGKSEGRRLVPGEIGQQQRQQFYQAAVPEMLDRGMQTSGQNIYNATGNYFGTSLDMPTYQNYMPPIVASPVAAKTPVPDYDPGYYAAAEGGAVRDLVKKYQVGGEVRRFQEGGDEGELAMPMPAVTAEPAGLAPVAAPAAPAAAMPEMMGGDRNAQLMGMLSRYFPQGDEYGAELKAARAANTRESDAFQQMLQDAIKQPRESGPDKAEMYFRLAAAFGAPTKTGHFAESLGKVGEATAGIQKERRESASADRARKLQLGLEAQKMRMTGAKEDLTTLRQLASEGMKDKRAIATELIKEYVKSGQPQSSAGKQAMDEGLKPGTPEFQARVEKIAELNVERQMGQINATLANMGVAQANAALQGQKFEFQQQQATKLTAPEMKLKTETEDLLAQTSQGYSNIKRALALNPNTFDTSLVDTAQRKMLESVGSKDPKVVNTRELENMLEKAALSQLKATFPGAISNDERQALLATQGMASKSIEERGRIMQNAADALKGIYARNKKRLNEINAGAYRATQMPGDE